MNNMSRPLLSVLRASGLAAITFASVTFGAAAQDAAGVSTGTPVDGENAIGRNYILETFGDWELRCIRVPEGQPEPCNMYQLLKDAEGTEVAEMTLFHYGQANLEAGATIIAPLETLLTDQLTVTVDGENARRYPFAFCNTIGCYSRLGLPLAEVDALKKGATATVTLTPANIPNQKVALDVSLSGFTAAYNRVTELNIAARAQAAAAKQQ